MEENQVAIQSGLRTEIAETFMDKMKDLFTESYIDVPESKVDLVDELAESVEELETRLNETTQKVIDTTGELEAYKRESVIREASRDLAETQVVKLKSLVEDIDFEDEDQFASKVKIVVESHFAKEITNSDEVEQVVEDADQEVEVSSVMEQYLATIRKTTPKR
jgi:phage shock protein A